MIGIFGQEQRDGRAPRTVTQNGKTYGHGDPKTNFSEIALNLRLYPKMPPPLPPLPAGKFSQLFRRTGPSLEKSRSPPALLAELPLEKE
jgi:hypothetical protein